MLILYIYLLFFTKERSCRLPIDFNVFMLFNVLFSKESENNYSFFEKKLLKNLLKLLFSIQH